MSTHAHHGGSRDTIAGCDVVVVGAGAAGCVLAERLSADPACRVVLIEAGTGKRPKEVRIPAAFPKLFDGPLDWAHRTEPQRGLADRALFWPRGRTLGGSAAINAQVWNHADAADEAAWRAVAPELFDVDRVREARRRVDERMAPTSLRDPNALTSAFLAAAAGTGLRSTTDLDDPLGGDRVGPVHVMQRRGLRRSPRDAYLDPARSRPNLTVVPDALVERVDVRDGRARGVVAVVGGERRTITADVGVVVAAGAIGSPHLLQRSGLGAADDLRRIGIRPVADLPAVGAHLADHLMSLTVTTTDGRVRTLKDAERLPELLSLAFRRSGMLTSNVAEAAAFLRTGSGLAAPDIELVFAPVMFLDHGFTAPPHHGATVGVVLLQPESRGTVRARSADATVAPAIDPGYLTDPDGSDLDRLVDGVERALAVLATEPLARHVAGFHEPARFDRTALADHVRRRAETIYHPTSTCRIGASSADSVIDASLAVHGVGALWVADASVLPSAPRCHTTAPTMVVAELAAEQIRGAIDPSQHGALVAEVAR
jgi:choline dehydrogenase